MNKVRVGILGCANIARKQAIRAFQAVENVELSVIASRNIEKAKKWATEFGIPEAETYDDLINNPKVDAIYIPLPIGLHKEWVIRAAKNGKHVICEKSLAGDLASAKEMIGACKKAGVVLYENFMCDFHPQHQRVCDLMKEERFGSPFIFRGYFGFPLMAMDNFRYIKQLGGGSLNDAGAYTVFMARKMMGIEPAIITAKLNYNLTKGVDMSGSALLEFSDGAIAQVAFNFDALYQNNYSIWGTKGLINVKRAYSIPPDMKPEIELVVNENFKEITTIIDVPATNQFELIFKDFCQTILDKDDKKKEIKYSGILNQATTLEAIRISAKEHRKVSISELN